MLPGMDPSHTRVPWPLPWLLKAFLRWWDRLPRGLPFLYLEHLEAMSPCGQRLVSSGTAAHFAQGSSGLAEGVTLPHLLCMALSKLLPPWVSVSSSVKGGNAHLLGASVDVMR